MKVIQQRLVKCPICGKAFHKFMGMKIHYNINHVRANPHYCWVCQQNVGNVVLHSLYYYRDNNKRKRREKIEKHILQFYLRRSSHHTKLKILFSKNIGYTNLIKREIFKKYDPVKIARKYFSL